MTRYKSHNKGPLEHHYKVPQKVQLVHFGWGGGKKCTLFWHRVTHRNNYSSGCHNLDTAECPSILFSPKSSAILTHKKFGDLVWFPNLAPKHANIFSSFLKDLEQHSVVTSQIIICVLENVPCAFPNTFESIMRENKRYFLKYMSKACVIKQ